MRPPPWPGRDRLAEDRSRHVKGVSMSRRSLVVGLLAVLCASAAPAGEIKFQVWPCGLIPQEITTIPVVMDVGYWIQIVNQDAFIKLKQIAIHTYEGCTDLRVLSNTDLRMSCSITSTGAGRRHILLLDHERGHLRARRHGHRLRQTHGSRPPPPPRRQQERARGQRDHTSRTAIDISTSPQGYYPVESVGRRSRRPASPRLQAGPDTPNPSRKGGCLHPPLRS